VDIKLKADALLIQDDFPLAFQQTGRELKINHSLLMNHISLLLQ
jgi:hypothetical protein